jgi:hypothetical protein
VVLDLTQSGAQKQQPGHGDRRDLKPEVEKRMHRDQDGSAYGGKSGAGLQARIRADHPHDQPAEADDESRRHRNAQFCGQFEIRVVNLIDHAEFRTDGRIAIAWKKIGKSSEASAERSTTDCRYRGNPDPNPPTELFDPGRIKPAD